jgi:hypothetical protein
MSTLLLTTCLERVVLAQGTVDHHIILTEMLVIFQGFLTVRNTLHHVTSVLPATVKFMFSPIVDVSIITIFKFSGNVNDYSNPSNVRNCYLVGLTDLYGKLEYVRDMVAGYFNHLIQIGVAGLRIDAAKHMWPEVDYKL